MYLNLSNHNKLGTRTGKLIVTDLTIFEIQVFDLLQTFGFFEHFLVHQLLPLETRLFVILKGK